MNRERQRWWVVAATLLMAAMLAWAPGSVAAGHGLVVASSHSTDSDFSGASITNMTIEGSGESATVTLSEGEVLNDSFDDLAGYSEYQVSGDASWSSTNGYARATGGTTGQELLINNSTSVVDPTLEVQNVTLLGGEVNEQPGVALAFQDADNFVHVRLNNNQDKLQIYQHVNGTLDEVSNTTYNFTADTAYNLVVKKDGQTVNATVYDQSGTQLVSTEGTIDASLDQSGQVGLSSVKDANGKLSWSDLRVTTPSQTPAEYVHTHSASDTEAGWVNITQNTNATVTVTWRGDEDGDGTYETTLNQSTTTQAGNQTFTWSKFGGDDVRLNVTVENDTSNGLPAFEFADEGTLFTSRAPNASNLQPPDGTKLSKSEVDFSVDVNDTDFPTAQGDSVDATLYLDGNAVGTKTVTSNGTVTITQTLSEGGDHTYHWELNDSYGETTTTATNTVTVPSEITFRNESNETQIIKDNVTIEATFYSADGTTVIKRTTSDGNISLEGLPTTKEFVITVSADGWYDRRAYIDGIYEQSNVFLLNSSAHPNAVDTTFTFEDRTGEFPQDSTTLRVQRALDPDNDSTYNWSTVAGDFFGASGDFPFTGAYQVRYRLVIENSDGDTRVLGAFIPTADSTETLVIGNIEWPVQNGTQQYFDANLDQGAQEIQIRYYDHENDTEDIRIRVWEHQNKSNTIYDSNFTGPYGQLAVNVSLTQNQTEKTWVANYTAVDNDTNIQGQRIVGSNPMGLPVAAWLLGTLCLGFLTIVGSLYGPRTAPLGAVTMVGTAMVLMYFQLVYIGTGFVIVALLIAIGSLLYTEGMP